MSVSLLLEPRERLLAGRPCRAMKRVQGLERYLDEPVPGTDEVERIILRPVACWHKGQYDCMEIWMGYGERSQVIAYDTVRTGGLCRA